MLSYSPVEENIVSSSSADGMSSGTEVEIPLSDDYVEEIERGVVKWMDAAGHVILLVL